MAAMAIQFHSVDDELAQAWRALWHVMNTASSSLPALEWPRLGAAMTHGAATVDEARSDAALMASFRSGDGDAFAALYRRHRERLHRFVLRLGGGTDVEEIFQDTWLAVIRGSERYAPQARFTTWLFSIAHRRTVDRHRAQWREAHAQASDADLDTLADDDSHAPEPEAWRAGAGAALLDAIDALPLLQREAFLLQVEGELTLEEIAKATGTSRETVKSRLRYAQRKLRTALEAWR